MSYTGASLIDIPAVALRVDGGDFVPGITRFRLHSEWRTPMTWLDLELDNALSQAPAIARGARIDFAPAYQGQSELVTIFSGTVQDVREGRAVAISAVDDAAKLRDLSLVRSWRNVTAQDVIQDVCDAAGLTVQLPPELTPRRAHFVAPSWSGLVVLAEVRRAWCLDWSLSVSPGAAYCGPWDASPQLLSGLIHTVLLGDAVEFEPAGPELSRGRVVLHLNPLMACGNVLVMVDDQFTGGRATCRIDEVDHVLEPHPTRPIYRTEAAWIRLA